MKKCDPSKHLDIGPIARSSCEKFWNCCCLVGMLKSPLVVYKSDICKYCGMYVGAGESLHTFSTHRSVKIADLLNDDKNCSLC